MTLFQKALGSLTLVDANNIQYLRAKYLIMRWLYVPFFPNP